MFDIRKLIDASGVLQIPETIQVGSDEGTRSFVYNLCTIGNNAFSNLTELKELHIPASVKEIKWSFYNCTRLKNIIVAIDNEYFKSIDGILFSKDSKTLIAYPNAHGKEYNVPEGVEIIEHFAFKTCTGIETIFLPNSLYEIGSNAFYRCDNLKKVFLPDNIRIIGEMCGDTNYNFRFVYRKREYTFDEMRNILNC